MSNPLYQEMMNQMGPNVPMQLLTQLKNNPVQFVLQRGFNLPQNVGSDPNSIIQHLLNTGQVSQDRYNQVMKSMQMARNFNGRPR